MSRDLIQNRYLYCKYGVFQCITIGYLMAQSKDTQLVKRISKLVEQNKELSQALREIRDKYDELLLKQTEYEEILKKYSDYKEIKNVLLTDRQTSTKFNMVTVMYADIHGFSRIIPSLESDVLIDQLDQLTMHFDEITYKYSFEKIKTIGDSYMCAGGIPEKNITNPVQVVLAAFEILQLVKSKEIPRHNNWQVRIAVHTGPVTASINGKTKVWYDIKGDTVNIASRMEASGVNGQLQISVMTYELIKEFFDCEYFGKLPVKYKGNLDIYSE